MRRNSPLIRELARRGLLGSQSHTFGHRKPSFWRMRLRRCGNTIGLLGNPRYERSERSIRREQTHMRIVKKRRKGNMKKLMILAGMLALLSVIAVPAMAQN